MIRQAISCDICGTEKKQTNHWFVAYDQVGELRLSGWKSRNRMRPGAKHLCGQTCLHKLVDEFMARGLMAQAQPGPVEEAEVEVRAAGALVPGTDASLTSDAAYGEVESSARLITTPIPVTRPIAATQPAPVSLERTPVRNGPVAMQARLQAPEQAGPEQLEPVVEELASFSSRKWRADAWEREREREMRAVDRRPDAEVRRRSGS
ncbi:MAG: hypothetical protein ABR976_20970 [Terracidiphilus sp.]